MSAVSDDGQPTRLATGERRTFRSLPVLRTSMLLSGLLVVAAAGLWWSFGPAVRAQFTAPQIATLLFFVCFMMGLMLSIGLSKAVATSSGLTVRNVLVTATYDWSQVQGVSFGSGDAWPYLILAPSTEHPDGESKMLLAIQRAEGGEVAEARVADLRALIAAHHSTATAACLPEDC